MSNYRLIVQLTDGNFSVVNVEAPSYIDAVFRAYKTVKDFACVPMLETSEKLAVYGFVTVDDRGTHVAAEILASSRTEASSLVFQDARVRQVHLVSVQPIWPGNDAE